MAVFFSDLDNTLIYSYKHDIGEDKVGVELYNDRVISFMTGKSYELLKEADRRLLFVPVTTRTPEQYARIDLGVRPQYALVCNGGMLLNGGVRDEEWYRASLELIRASEAEMKKAQELMNCDKDRCFEVRSIYGLFLFTKSEKPQETVERLKAGLDLKKVGVFSNGQKIYAVPLNMDKGTAVRRFRQRFGADKCIAAGDSAFDVPMLREADFAFAPKGLWETADVQNMPNTGACAVCDTDKEFFSDFILENYSRFI